LRRRTSPCQTIPCARQSRTSVMPAGKRERGGARAHQWHMSTLRSPSIDHIAISYAPVSDAGTWARRPRSAREQPGQAAKGGRGTHDADVVISRDAKDALGVLDRLLQLVLAELGAVRAAKGGGVLRRRGGLTANTAHTETNMPLPGWPGCSPAASCTGPN
jgi:hypothetical protein